MNAAGGLTMTQNEAFEVRVLTREEIAELVAAGKVTPIEQIPDFHELRRLSFPGDDRA